MTDLPGRDQTAQVVGKRTRQPLQKVHVSNVVTDDDILKKNCVQDVAQVVEDDALFKRQVSQIGQSTKFEVCVARLQSPLQTMEL